MAAVGGVGAEPAHASDRLAAWARWWVAGTRLDWAFAGTTTLLVAAGYYDSWLTRNQSPVPSWADAPVQAAWLAVVICLGVAGIVAWRRDRSLDSLVPA